MRSVLGILFICILIGGCRNKDDIDLNTLFTSQAEGCHSFRVWRFNDKETVGISVSGSRSNLGLSATETVIDLDTVSKLDLWVMIREFQSPPGIFQCNNGIDVDPNQSLLWEASEGIARLRITNDNLSDNRYQITVTLENVVFELQTDPEETLNLDYLEFPEVIVND